MLRDKEIPIPRALKNKRVVIDFADRPREQYFHWKGAERSLFWCLEHVEADPGQIQGHRLLAGAGLGNSFFSTYFAAPDFLVTLLEAADVIRNRESWSLANIFKAVTWQDRRHVSDRFGHGNMPVRLQGNIFRQLGRTQARTSLLANNNFKNISWKDGAQWRPKSDIFPTFNGSRGLDFICLFNFGWPSRLSTILTPSI